MLEFQDVADYRPGEVIQHHLVVQHLEVIENLVYETLHCVFYLWADHLYLPNYIAQCLRAHSLQNWVFEGPGEKHY